MKASCLMRAAKVMANSQYAEGMKCGYTPTQSSTVSTAVLFLMCGELLLFFAAFRLFNFVKLGLSDKF